MLSKEIQDAIDYVAPINEELHNKPNAGVRYRDWMFDVDGRKCVYCGFDFMQNFEAFRTATKDHLIPVSLGGSNSQRNRYLACHACNTQRRNQMPKAFAMEKFFKSSKPPWKDADLPPFLEAVDNRLVLKQGKDLVKTFIAAVKKEYLNDCIKKRGRVYQFFKNTKGRIGPRPPELDCEDCEEPT